MFDRVTIAYRGAGYEIGRGRDFYGIWPTGGSRPQPLGRWPETPDGWSAAWTRFTEMEQPGTIAPAGRTGTDPARSTASAETAAAPGGSWGPQVAVGAALLIAAGVALGVIGLFPTYLTGASLAQQPPQLIPHVIYLAVWSLSAVLIGLGGSRLRAGALLGTGLSVVTFGLYLADAGTPIAGGAHLAGAGMVLTMVGWIACAAGSVIALLARPTGSGSARMALVKPGRFGMPRGAALGPAILLVISGIGAAVAFAPAWDSYTLRTASGQTQYLTAGNAFSNPGPVIAGDILVMVALAAAVIAAALWRPVRHGAVLLAGAAVPMVAQIISAVVQVSEATPPQQFGLTPAQANELGLTISNGLTPVFWIYCAFVVALAVSCLWMLSTPQEPVPAQALPADAPIPAASASASAPGVDYTWNSDSHAWYAATPDPVRASGAPVPGIPAPRDADTTQVPGDHTAPENDQAS